jgi:hypothetical protein
MINSSLCIYGKEENSQIILQTDNFTNTRVPSGRTNHVFLAFMEKNKDTII